MRARVAAQLFYKRLYSPTAPNTVQVTVHIQRHCTVIYCTVLCTVENLFDKPVDVAAPHDAQSEKKTE